MRNLIAAAGFFIISSLLFPISLLGYIIYFAYLFLVWRNGAVWFKPQLAVNCQQESGWLCAGGMEASPQLLSRFWAVSYMLTVPIR